MAKHPALSEGRVAVVTGAASGIGLAAAKRFAAMGLRICLADLEGDALEQAGMEVGSIAQRGASDVLTVPTDVGKLDEVQRLKERVYDTFGEVAVLMNNAGTCSKRGFEDRDPGYVTPPAQIRAGGYPAHGSDPRAPSGSNLAAATR